MVKTCGCDRCGNTHGEPWYGMTASNTVTNITVRYVICSECAKEFGDFLRMYDEDPSRHDRVRAVWNGNDRISPRIVKGYVGHWEEAYEHEGDEADE